MTCEAQMRKSRIKTPKSLGSNILKEFRDAYYNAEIQHRELAKLAGVSNSALTYWITGRSSPSVHLLEAVAQVLGYRLVLEKVKSDD